MKAVGIILAGLACGMASCVNDSGLTGSGVLSEQAAPVRSVPTPTTASPTTTPVISGPATTTSAPPDAPSPKLMAAVGNDGVMAAASSDGSLATRSFVALQDLVYALNTPLPKFDVPALPLNLYAQTGVGKLSPSVADIPARVYVPNSESGTLTVIDPATFKILGTYRVGSQPHHVVPGWDMGTLYVLDTAGNALIPIDPRVGRPDVPIRVEDPYNLYFTPNGKEAIVVAERFQRLDIRNPRTWELLASIPVPHAGVNHGDFSPDGRYFYASCEYSGWVVVVDLVTRRVVAERRAGVQPIDVKLAPDASVLYVADQARNGVMVLNPTDLGEITFLPTGAGTHGLYPSRDGTKLYASNRLGGSVSVIDFASRQIVATWRIPGGGSPDMGGVSPDGSQLWLAGRFHGEVYVFNTATGGLLARIPVGTGAHGLCYFPQPGRFSMGHTGNYR